MNMLGYISFVCFNEEQERSKNHLFTLKNNVYYLPLRTNLDAGNEENLHRRMITIIF